MTTALWSFDLSIVMYMPYLQLVLSISLVSLPQFAIVLPLIFKGSSVRRHHFGVIQMRQRLGGYLPGSLLITSADAPALYAFLVQTVIEIKPKAALSAGLR